MSRLSENRRLSCVIVLLMIMYLGVYHLLESYSSGESKITIPIRQTMSGPLSQDDPSVIKYILETGLLVPPSKLAYNLSHPNEDYGGPVWGVQPPMTVIRSVLRELNMTEGDRFFVECGALDGETLSNTLYLERNLGWKGLLVEMHPHNYERLRSKNRKAWLSKSCLSIHPFPGNDLNPETQNSRKLKEVEIQCLPLFTLLSAINVTTVDYFSLDADGSELQILKTIPFDKGFIKTLTVENSHDKDQMLEFMKNKGYIDIADSKFPKKFK